LRSRWQMPSLWQKLIPSISPRKSERALGLGLGQG
jgi:hypothetical protein